MTAKKRAIKVRLKQLEDETGFLDLDLVIEAAKNPQDPMHDQFTWDLEQAALERWRDQARAMIRSVKYVEQTTQQELAAPHYVSVTVRPNKGGYRTLDDVKTKKDLSAEVFNDEIKRATAALDRARAVSDVLGKSAELEAIISQLTVLLQAA